MMDELERTDFCLINAEFNRGKGDANPSSGTDSPVETGVDARTRRA